MEDGKMFQGGAGRGRVNGWEEEPRLSPTYGEQHSCSRFLWGVGDNRAFFFFFFPTGNSQDFFIRLMRKSCEKERYNPRPVVAVAALGNGTEYLYRSLLSARLLVPGISHAGSTPWHQ